MSDGGVVARAQAALGELAFELLAIQERLVNINRGLPVPPNQDDMLEGRIAPDLATEVSGRIECIAEDSLRRVIEALQGAACLTAHDLERDFREQQKRRRREWR
jgi:LPS O-antigen subunit length determinant protein (WzzB/FepE family)